MRIYSEHKNSVAFALKIIRIMYENNYNAKLYLQSHTLILLKLYNFNKIYGVILCNFAVTPYTGSVD